MYILEVKVYDRHDIPTIKTITADTREEIETRAEQVVDAIRTMGMLDDDNPKLWTYLPPSAISGITFEFSNDEEQDNG